MSTALVIALMAVAISLFTVFIALRAAQLKKKDGSDNGTPMASDASGSDCSTSDGDACDGGGGD
jgi:hypothetical protein